MAIFSNGWFTIICKIFETNSSFHVKYRTMGRVQYAFFKRFLLVLTKFSFWAEDEVPHNSFGNSYVPVYH